ncbi:MAG: flagellin [Anaerovibrio sp.]|uniref:flagellin n=1 Tax=Anaerovibrio sp. TaxID=1872532 RepID=UPI0025EEB691|nr:flagellin [Anaerovibrio sp.]MCR5175241.1 flagellin [Anaerovibrio sp.]
MATISSYAQQLSILNIMNSKYAAAAKSLNQVATGNKINSPKDDASGYAIGKRMSVEIGSLEQTLSNVQTGNSMLNVANGAMSSTLDILQTLKEKAIAAANDTAKDSDRAAIQQELNQYIDQINDNALVTYNGKYLLNGTNSTATEATNQAYTNRSLGLDTTGATKLTDLTRRQGDNLNIDATDTVNISFVKDGKTYSTSFAAGEATLADIFNKANEAGAGTVFDTSSMDTATSLIGQDTTGKELHTVDEKNAITVKTAESGKAGSIAGFTISITDSSGNEKKSVDSVLDDFTESIVGADKREDNSLVLHTGTHASQNMHVGLGDMSARALGLQGSDGSYLSVSTQEHANAAINVIDNAIERLLSQQTTVGAMQSRLSYTQSNITTQQENVTSAMTTIIGADMAKAITEYTSNNIQMQAAQAMLAQANSNSGWFLNLLR